MKRISCGLLVVVGLVSGCGHINVSQPKPSVSTEMNAADQQERYDKRVQDLQRQGYTSGAANRGAAKQVPMGETVYSDSLYNVLTGKSGK